MRQDKILKKIHQTQFKLRSIRKNISWNKEVKLINKIAQRIAKQFNYSVFPVSKTA